MNMRQVLKTTTYALMHFVVAVGVAYGLTRNWQVALGIGLIEPIVQTVAYTIHERVWERSTRLKLIRFGPLFKNIRDLNPA